MLIFKGGEAATMRQGRERYEAQRRRKAGAAAEARRRTAGDPARRYMHTHGHMPTECMSGQVRRKPNGADSPVPDGARRRGGGAAGAATSTRSIRTGGAT